MSTFVDEGLGHASYLVDVGDGTAAIIDPPRFPTHELAAARKLGLRLRWTLDTHSHADYVSGSPGLARRQVEFVAPAASKLATPHLAVHDEERLTLGGGLVVRALATPGHTPDHHAFLLERRGEPVALFSGGSLMVGAVGRTDLCGPDLAEPLARDMFASLRRFDCLPDDVPVYPTHGAGSFCSAPGGAARTSTLGRERATNRLFGIGDEDVFVDVLLSGFGSFPSYFRELPERNRLGAQHYDRLPDVEPLDLATVDRLLVAGAALVDARAITEFARGHIPGAISNALRPVFGTWLGWVIGLDRPVVLVADEHQSRTEMVRQSLDIGHDAIAGELDGGMDAWRAAGRTVHELAIVGPTEVVGSVIDVRQRGEFEAGHVPSAVNIELGALAHAAVPDGPVTVMCGHGERAMTAASILAARGRRDLRVLDGGPGTWSSALGERLSVGR